MILDSLEHMDFYQGIGHRLYEAMQFIRNADFTGQEDGCYEVDGRDFRYLLQSYPTREVNDTPEGHRDFIDLQYMISGEEQVGMGRLDAMTELVESHPDRDLWLYRGPMSWVTVHGGQFLICFPHDVHAPCVTPSSGPNHVRKCVFKIHV